MLINLIVKKFKTILNRIAWTFLISVPSAFFIAFGFIFGDAYHLFNFGFASIGALISFVFVYIIEAISIPPLDKILSMKDREELNIAV